MTDKSIPYRMLGKDDGEQTPETAEQPPVGDEPKTYDADYVANLRKEAAKYRTEAKANADAAKRLAAFEESQKSETQKLADRLAEAERERDAMRTESMRLRIAAEKGLSPKQAARLRGSSEEELLADAEELLADFQPAGPRRPVGNVDQGIKPGTPAEPEDPASLAAAVVAQRGY